MTTAHRLSCSKRALSHEARFKPVACSSSLTAAAWSVRPGRNGCRDEGGGGGESAGRSKMETVISARGMKPKRV